LLFTCLLSMEKHRALKILRERQAPIGLVGQDYAWLQLDSLGDG
jgi:hypothetical protein